VTPDARARAIKIAKYVAIVVVLAYVVISFRKTWEESGASALSLHVHWHTIALSWAIVMASYAVLIQTWRVTLGAWGGTAHVPFATAARIFFVSSLARNVPGKVWQIGAMAVLSKEANVPPTAATGAALLSTLVNIASGMLLAGLLGWRDLTAIGGGGPFFAIALVAIGAGSIVLAPAIVPVVARLAERVTRRTFTISSLPWRAVFYAFVGNVIAWVLYGVAFRTFLVGVGQPTPGSVVPYVVVWAVSYVVGYLFFFQPAGLGVREKMMATALGAFGLVTNEGQAMVISLASRLWLTIPEILPGLIFLAIRPRTRSNDSASDNAAGSGEKAP
jgi:hypothetical protein